jgi:hypothetical protein
MTGAQRDSDWREFVADIVERHQARLRRERRLDIVYSIVIVACIAGFVTVLLSGAGQ